MIASRTWPLNEIGITHWVDPRDEASKQAALSLGSDPVEFTRAVSGALQNGCLGPRDRIDVPGKDWMTDTPIKRCHSISREVNAPQFLCWQRE